MKGEKNIKRGESIPASINVEMTKRLVEARNLASQHCDEGIGTLSEKTAHKILKFYIEPNSEKHEVPVLDSVADVLNSDGIWEIQTRSFEKLLPKLKKLLAEYPVTVVHPLTASRYVSYVDSESGEVLSRRKSPRRDSVNRAACELYKISELLLHPNLKVKIIFIAYEDLRYKRNKKAWQKPSESLIERIPTHIASELTLECKEDYRAFLPDGVGARFTAKDMTHLTGLDARRAHNTLTLLLSLGIIERKKEGRVYVYSVV